MSRPCEVPYYQNYWYLYKEDCDRKLKAKTEEMEDFRNEVSDLDHTLGFAQSEIPHLLEDNEKLRKN